MGWTALYKMMDRLYMSWIPCIRDVPIPLWDRQLLDELDLLYKAWIQMRPPPIHINLVPYLQVVDDNLLSVYASEPLARARAWQGFLR